MWHEGLWHVLRGYNIDERIVGVLEDLYKQSSSAVLLNNQIGSFFRTTVGVRQGCHLSPVLFNLFLERIMQETLDDHLTSISIGGRPICNLRFADDIDLMGGTNDELQNLTTKLANRSSAYGMEISAEKSKTMVNSSSRDTNTSITMNGVLLEEVNQFKYLGATLSKDGYSTAEIGIRIAQATAAMARLERVWRSKISFPTKYRLFGSLVVSILLYGCESWTLMADTEKKVQAFENKSLRKLLRISWREHKTNEYVRKRVEELVGPQETLLATVKRRKLKWFGHVTRHDGLSKTIMQGTVAGGRRRGRQRKSWSDNIKEWTAMTTPELLRAANSRSEWRRKSVSAASMSPPRPQLSRD